MSNEITAGPPMADVTRARPHLFLGSRLRRLAEQMQGDVTLVGERAGIPLQPGQYPVLALLGEGPRTIGEIARGLGLSQPAATQAIGRLRALGLVGAGVAGRDRRERRVALSAEGRALLERSEREVWPAVEAAVREALDGLEGPFLAQIAALEARLAERPLNRRAAEASARLDPLASDLLAADPLGGDSVEDVSLTEARSADLPAVAALMNRAYRDPEGSWTNEAAYLSGDRTSVAMLHLDIGESPGGRLLLWRRGSGKRPGALLGCVWLQPEGQGRWYLGSLTVDPAGQNAGLGRRLLAAAEAWIADRGGREVRMTVVNVRDSLIAWYIRRGYALTGETEPFPYGDDRFGVPRRGDLAFVVLAKRLGAGGDGPPSAGLAKAR